MSRRPRRPKDLSRVLTAVLRHKALDMGLTMDSAGYVKLSDILAIPSVQRFPQGQRTEVAVRRLVRQCSKQRFSMRQGADGCAYIRANQGHSIKGLNDAAMLRPVRSASGLRACVHGTYWRFMESIRKGGLNRMSRKHIHFSFEQYGSQDTISGMRSDCQVLIHVDVARCLAAGIRFFMSDNKVILSEGRDGVIAPEYFSRVQEVEWLRVGGKRQATLREVKDWKTIEIPKDKFAPNSKAQSKWKNFSEKGRGRGVQKGCQASLGQAGPAQQSFRMLAVLDFEATCDDGKRMSPQEIIEFPTVLVDVKTGTSIGEFATYVKPTHHPQLTPFCTNLTGITQEQVDEGVGFPRALAAHQKWLLSRCDGKLDSVLFVTCGNWDLGTMLRKQCKTSGIEVPPAYRRFCNIKFAFRDFYKRKKAEGMARMLNVLKLELIGKHHSGIDDCRNLARICERMIKDGHVFAPTTRR